MDYEIDKDQATFFDRIYPSISQRLNSLEKENITIKSQMFELHMERKELNNMINQYKKKIQRVEQFLIKHGLIKLLTKEI